MGLHWRKVDTTRLYEPFYLSLMEFFLNEMGEYDFYVTEGFRTVAQSQQGYANYKAGKGPRYAPPYKSAHNYGLAVDVVLDIDSKTGLQPSWDVKLSGWMALKSKLIGHPRFGHLWHLHDWPHIEEKNWKTLIDWSQPYEKTLQMLNVWSPEVPTVLV